MATFRIENSRPGAKFPLDTVSPSQQRVEPREPLEDMFGEKLNLGKDSGQPEKNKALECKELPEDSLSRSGEKVPEDSMSLKPDEYLDYFPDHYVVGWNGIKVYAEVTRPKKKKKPKAIKIKENRRFGEKREDLEDSFFRESEEMEKNSRMFACAALSYLLREQGRNLELVKPGLYELGKVTGGYRAHFNFKAKREDEPSAPVETYFGQLCYYGKTEIVVECCVSMGESDSLPYEPENRGCQYCTEFVYHPLGGCKGIVWGMLTYARNMDTYTIA